MSEITEIAGVPLEEYGDIMKIEGVIVGDGDRSQALFLPGKLTYPRYATLPQQELTIDEAVAWLKQSDNATSPIYSRADEILTGHEVERVVRATYQKAKREVSRVIAWTVYRRDGFQCRYCGAEGVLTYDHFIPVALGGETTVENGVTACNSCNNKKSHKSPAEWIKYMMDHPQRYKSIDLAWLQIAGFVPQENPQ